MAASLKLTLPSLRRGMIRTIIPRPAALIELTSVTPFNEPDDEIHSI
jgi:hypothetical protein